MLITENLPINRQKFVQQDQILVITGACWLDYQKFDQENSGYHVSYLDGEIIIVSPGRNHERIVETINRLIVAYCEKYQISDFPFGQTRLVVPGKAGREPDIAYAFNFDKQLPDLVVEVIFSSGDVERLKTSYKDIGIAELWIWKNNQITFYSLESDGYIIINSSKILSGIESKSLVKYINLGITQSPSVIKQDFLKNI